MIRILRRIRGKYFTRVYKCKFAAFGATIPCYRGHSKIPSFIIILKFWGYVKQIKSPESFDPGRSVWLAVEEENNRKLKKEKTREFGGLSFPVKSVVAGVGVEPTYPRL